MKNICPLRSMKVTLLICLLVLVSAAQAPDSRTSSRQPNGQPITSILNADGSIKRGASKAFPLVTLNVTNTNDSGSGSLRQAIADAAPGDTINFNVTGAITLTSGQLVIDKNLTIQGPGASLLSISGNNSSRVFYVNSGVTATLDGMTIRNGYAYGPGTIGGGGIFNDGGALTVSNSSISGNDGYFHAGGIFNYAGTLTVSNSTISGNTSLKSNLGGGGIFSRGALVVNNSTISGNSTAGSGGGVYTSGTLTVTDSTVSGNTAAPGEAGGIFVEGDSTEYGVTLALNSSTVSDNTGDGILVVASSVAVNNSTISGNTGDGINITNSTLIYETLIVHNSTVSGNTSRGIYCRVAGNLTNTIVASNSGGDMYIPEYGHIETARHNLIGNAASSGGITNGVNGNIVGVNPLLGPLRNNGGPTLTHALLPGSPAINAGSDCALTANGCGIGNPAMPTDQRGMPRNGNVDIGAFERQSNEPSSAAAFDFDGDGRSDVSVFRPSDSVWYIDRSSAGFTAAQFGISTDKITPADYDGDGKTDISIFRDGTWWRINSGSSTVSAVQFGIAGDIPVPGDYNGDGRDELAVYRSGEWWREGVGRTNFGIATDKPVPADYDGDGKTDIAIFRDGVWWRINSSNGSVEVVQFGVATDLPLTGDFDGDGKNDPAVYRDGTWYLLQSTAGFTAYQFGVASDITAPADYDGDGKTDAAVYRNGVWYVLRSTGELTIQQFGVAGDKPIPSAYPQ